MSETFLRGYKSTTTSFIVKSIEGRPIIHITLNNLKASTFPWGKHVPQDLKRDDLTEESTSSYFEPLDVSSIPSTISPSTIAKKNVTNLITASANISVVHVGTRSPPPARSSLKKKNLLNLQVRELILGAPPNPLALMILLSRTISLFRRGKRRSSSPAGAYGEESC